MKDCLNYLRSLSWPIIRDDLKCIDSSRLRTMIYNFYLDQLRFDFEGDMKTRNKEAKELTLQFLSNFKQIREDGWDITLGIGKLTPKEMDEAFGYAKNPNPGHTYFAGRNTRSKDNPPTENA